MATLSEPEQQATSGERRWSGDLVAVPAAFLREISASASTEALFRAVAKWLPATVACARASIALRHDDDHLMIMAVEGDKVLPVDGVVSVHETMTGASFLEKTTKITHAPDALDATAGEKKDIQLLFSRGMKSVANIPLVVNHECLGTMNMAHTDAGYFTPVRIQMLEAIAFWTASQLALHQKIEELVRRRDEARQAFDARVAAENANRLKSQFLANMSHELRTPMNGVLGMTALLLQSELTDAQKHQLTRIEQSGEALLRLLNNILDLSKIEAGRVELELVDFDTEMMVESVVAVMRAPAQEKDLTIDVAIDTAVAGRLRGDTTRIQQVLYNLIGNAIKFTRTGRIGIGVDRPHPGAPDTALRFKISDTGIGIPDDAVARIFDTFTQADSSTTRLYGGSGLGLSICRQLVQLMDGEIGVESTVGVGSTFWFTVRCERPAESDGEARAGASAERASDRPLRILVAEDNIVNQEVTAMTLESRGHSVLCVGNGVEAIEAVQQAPYDLILMDIQMPEMDGVTATERIRALPGAVAHVPIIALTADAMRGDREKYLAAGMNGYADKPIRPDELLTVIYAVMAPVNRAARDAG